MLKGPTSWAAARGARAQRLKDFSGIFENTVLENFGFHKKKEFLRKLSEILARVLKKVRQSCPKPKKNFLINIGLKGRQTIRLPGEPTCLGPTLTGGGIIRRLLRAELYLKTHFGLDGSGIES